jgi:hypothetical protein
MLRNFRLRARRPVRPPPFWEFVNGSRDLLFRGVSSCSLSINNLLCGHEDLYFPSDVLSSVATIFSIYHFSIYSEMKLAYVSISLKSFSMKNWVYLYFRLFVSHFAVAKQLWEELVMPFTIYITTAVQ